MRWRVLFFPLLCLPLALAAQPKHYAWPRNAQTDSVEFRGVLPWPADTLTEVARQALVQRWYHTRLQETRKIPTDKSLTMTWRAPDARTYAHLPAGSYFDLELIEELCRLEYRVDLRPTPAGLAYRLWEFEFGCGSHHAAFNFNLEHVLTFDPVRRLELDRLHHRLRVALAHW